MKSRFDTALRFASALLPAAVGAIAPPRVAAASHDLENVRVVGAGFTGVFRALDLFVSAPLLLLPIGTRGARAALVSAILTGICGALGFDVVRRMLETVPAALRRVGASGDKPVSPRFLSAVSALAVLTALLSPAWQTEAAAPGGGALGALLVIAALRFAMDAEVDDLPAGAFLLGLAASYEPLVFVAAALGASLQVAALARSSSRDTRVRSALAFALGLVPLLGGLALLRRPPEVATVSSSLVRGALTALPTFAATELGTVMLVMLAAGTALSLAVPESRRVALPLLFVAATGALGVVLHVSAGPTSYAPVVLAALFAGHALAAVALGAVVVVISRMRVPMAEASAALVVVLELVLPVRAVDETFTRREARAPHAEAVWNDVAWGELPPSAAVLVADSDTMRRIASVRAEGRMRDDLLVVPLFDVLGREGQRALLREPKLAPLYRDIALGVSPEELSLGALAAERPVFTTFQPTWDRSLARHLVPAGLLSRFEAEPRSVTERKKGLDAFGPTKERLVRVSVTKNDPDLSSATAVLLRARAIALAVTGERELLARALEDLRTFAPDDRVGSVLVRRSVTTKGSIDVRDLTP